jgi:hypothetical protein
MPSPLGQPPDFAADPSASFATCAGGCNDDSFIRPISDDERRSLHSILKPRLFAKGDVNFSGLAVRGDLISPPLEMPLGKLIVALAGRHITSRRRPASRFLQLRGIERASRPSKPNHRVEPSSHIDGALFAT